MGVDGSTVEWNFRIAYAFPPILVIQREGVHSGGSTRLAKETLVSTAPLAEYGGTMPSSRNHA